VATGFRRPRRGGAFGLRPHAPPRHLFIHHSLGRHYAKLATNIQWVDRDWTVMGFLWGIYSHRSYHLGNIDIYLREADEQAPDFFSTFRQTLA